MLPALCACGGQVKLSEYQTLEVVVPAATDAYPEETVLYQGIPLRSGQVIVSEGSSALGFMMELMAEGYSPYVHAGVVSLEEGKAYVYEAVAALSLRFWNPPTSRLKGHVRRVSLGSYLQRQSVTAIYQHEDTQLDQVAAFVRLAYQRRLPFDGYFDYRSEGAVYCTEFVAQALAAGGGGPIRPTPRSANHSLNRAMAWLRLDTPGFILPSSVLADARRIALLSNHFSEAQIQARFAYKREMHRRFSANQSLGNIFEWTRRGPRIRSHLEDLYAALMDEADSVDDPESWVLKRVNERLGDFPSARDRGPTMTHR